ncbi:MAG: hypothetical protein ACXADC_05155 [Candidatus Thorarchaeota archaeon]|jgi:hypothetical protein
MKTQTKLIGIGALVLVLLSGIIVMAVFDDIEGPLIYEIDILPVTPSPGDMISVVIYAIDPSGVSNAKLSWSVNGEVWNSKSMTFFACLCVSGGRWVADFGPVHEGDTLEFYGTVFDSSPYENPAETQVFSVEISS